jgi:hypothetical protein
MKTTPWPNNLGYNCGLAEIIPTKKVIFVRYFKPGDCLCYATAQLPLDTPIDQAAAIGKKHPTYQVNPDFNFLG